MIAKCANPSCSAIFDHRAGRLYRFPKRPTEEDSLGNSHCVQHLWLCAVCCETHSLKYDPELGITIAEFLDQTSSPRRSLVIAAA